MARQSGPGFDLAAPSDFGAMPSALKRSPAPNIAPDPAPQSDHTVSPEALHYHDDEQRCDGCDHYGQDGKCAVLKMQVPAEGGCNAFSGPDSDGEDNASDDGMAGADAPPPNGVRRLRGGYGS